MFPKLTRTVVALLALFAVAAPASHAASDNTLRSSPQMFRVDDDTVRLNFTTKTKLKSVRIEVAGRGSVKQATAKGRHGEDFRYTATLTLRKPVEVGKKYTVKFRLDGGDELRRTVKVYEDE